MLDLAKWDAALYTEKILKQETLATMWSPAKLNNGTYQQYGFGWDLGEIEHHRRISHAGLWSGFSAQLDRYVDDQLTVIILTNLAESSPGRIARAVAGTFLPDLAARAYAPIDDRDPTVTARFFDVLRRAREGKLRPEEFTVPVWEYLEPRVEQMKRDFTALGPIQKLTLIEQTQNGAERSYRYRARFSRTTMTFHFVLADENRISVMMPEQINE